MQVFKFRFAKLVRDKIPDILETKGIKLFYQILSGEKRVLALKDKLFEEANELIVSQSREEILSELVDVYDVLEILEHLHGLQIETNQVLFRGRSRDFLYENLLEIVKQIKEESHVKLILNDIYSVLEAISDYFNISHSELKNVRRDKMEKSGGFLLGIFAEYIEIDASSESATIKFFHNQPEKYPQIL